MYKTMALFHSMTVYSFSEYLVQKIRMDMVAMLRPLQTRLQPGFLKCVPMKVRSKPKSFYNVPMDS